jgi:hypothetical protein
MVTQSFATLQINIAIKYRRFVMDNKSNLFALALVLAIGMLVQPWGNHQQETQRETGSIQVTGEAEVKVVPDEVRLTIGVETRHAELNIARNRNDRRVEELIKIAKDFGIRSKDIQTDYIHVEPYYSDSYYYGDIEGYYVRKAIVLVLHDMTRFEALLTALTEGGATHIHGIQFRTTELRKYRDQARALAVKAAQEKAAAMASELDTSIGAPTNIREENVGWWSWYGHNWWASGYGAMSQNVVQNAGPTSVEVDGSIAPGQISVTARVAATFELIN